MDETHQPPAISFFDAPRAERGDRDVAIVLGPLQIELHGLDDVLAHALAERYAPYSAQPREGTTVLRVRVGVEDREYFVPPGGYGDRVQVRIACDEERVRYLSHRVAGFFPTAGGEGRLLLARGDYEPDERAIENFVRASVAWLAASSGGALVHAASAVLDGRAYLFYGASGAGKSTLAASNRRGRVVSDDLSLVLPGGSGALELVGSPFRGTFEDRARVVGSFPLAAGFRLVQDTTAAVRPVPRIRAIAELTANLPFVVDSSAGREGLLGSVEAAFREIPLSHLHFRKDDSFWDAIAEAGY